MQGYNIQSTLNFYYSTVYIGHQIFPVAWKVVEALDAYKITVVSLTSDGAKPNRRFYRLCQLTSSAKKMPYKCVNPYNSDFDLFFYCDAPHLLKTTRNCFSNSFAHLQSRKMQVSKHTII